MKSATPPAADSRESTSAPGKSRETSTFASWVTVGWAAKLTSVPMASLSLSRAWSTVITSSVWGQPRRVPARPPPQPPRDGGADAGDVAVAHADEVEGDERDGRLAVAEDEGAGEQVVVDAGRGAAQVAVVAAEVEAVLQVLGGGGCGGGGGAGEEGRRGHGSAQYSREALRPRSRRFDPGRGRAPDP